MKLPTHLFVVSCALLLIASSPPGSADALDNWHVRRPPQPTNELNAVTYANGLFVAVGSSGNYGEVVTSPDGVVWTSQVSSSSNRLSGVAYGNGRFVAVGAPLATAVMSTNGVVWTTATNPPSATELAYGNGSFIAITRGNGSGVPFYSSPDGLNWTGRNSGMNTGPEDITYGHGRFVVVGRNPFIPVVSVWASTNGIDWFESGPVAGQSDGLYVVTWSGGLFAAEGYGINLASSDGEHWTRSFGPDYFPKHVTFGDGLFLAVGVSNYFASPPRVLTSADGLRWEVHESGWTNQLNGVAYGNGTFVAVGAGGAILQSEDTRPHLSATIEASTGGVQLSITGGLVRCHRVQAATELPTTNWTDLLTFTNTGPATNFVDTSATNFNRRFYRVVSP
jgi:hypothetical protein